MNIFVWIVVALGVGYLARRWYKRHALEVRPADFSVEPARPTRPVVLGYQATFVADPSANETKARRARQTEIERTERQRSRARAPVSMQLAAPQAAPRQAWQETLSRGAAELDRLVAIGDWDSARDALQHVAYDMAKASTEEKLAFTAAMCPFAARDPLVQRVVAVALAKAIETPGLLQSKLYPHIPDVTPELVRYALFYAAELGQIRRTKKGRSYALFAPS